eukprot:COSAG06_NODE_4532_length_4170_cov_1.936379_1_plen_44_part_10
MGAPQTYYDAADDVATNLAAEKKVRAVQDLCLSRNAGSHCVNLL